MRLTACLLLLPFAACAGHPRPTMYSYWAPKPKPKSTAPVYVADRIDGSYQGTVYLTSAPHKDYHHYWRTARISDQICPRTYYGIIEIGDHTLNYAYAPDVIFAAPVPHDGTFSEKVGSATMTGKLNHGRLTFNITTPLCTSRFFGDFKLNHS